MMSLLLCTYSISDLCVNIIMILNKLYYCQHEFQQPRKSIYMMILLYACHISSVGHISYISVVFINITISLYLAIQVVYVNIMILFTARIRHGCGVGHNVGRQNVGRQNVDKKAK